MRADFMPHPQVGTIFEKWSTLCCILVACLVRDGQHTMRDFRLGSRLSSGLLVYYSLLSITAPSIRIARVAARAAANVFGLG